MGFLSRLFGFGQSPPGSPPQGVATRLQGSGAFLLPVVGESRYQDAIEAICGPRAEEGEDRPVEARLVLENDNPYDSMAVRVDIQGQTVGYLSREHARRYRKQYAATEAYCDARIRGGWDRGEGREGYYGVVLDLDLPIDDSNATRYIRTAEDVFSTRLDDLGQPPKALYGPRVARRLVSELLGVCKGMICDGEVTDAELLALKRWLASHEDATRLYPGNTLAKRLLDIYKDKNVAPDERQELYELLLDLTGETEEHDQPLNLSTRLPLDEPPPTILFKGHVHVFTGRMAYGKRQVCERKVEERGGRVDKTVTRRTNFLVIGPTASSAWLESTHGRKILRAVELRSEGLPVRIVSEEAWIHAIESG